MTSMTGSPRNARSLITIGSEVITVATPSRTSGRRQRVVTVKRATRS
jgi:hypothetical protein